MGRILLVAKAEQLKKYKQLAKEYNAAFEINDFFQPSVLEDEKECERLISLYEQVGVPEGSTMHGAFYDVIVFSEDEEICRIAKHRMEQSLEIAQRLHVKGVVFHTNVTPMLCTSAYNQTVIDRTCNYLKELLERYSGIDIYMENMFDADPAILVGISQQLYGTYANYGVCLDYAHASISPTPVSQWVKELAPYIKHLHINDNDLQNDLHLAVGDGSIDWELFGHYYKKYFSQCSLLIETTQPENQRRSFEYLQQHVFCHNEEQEAENLLEEIFRYMTLLADERGFHATIRLLTDMGRTLVNSERASFWYWDKAKKQYWTMAALDSERIVVPEGTGIVGVSIQNNETVRIDDPYKDPRFNSKVDKETGFVTKSILCMPVTNARGDVIGAYQAINKRGKESVFTQKDVKRLTLAAVYCGKTLESHLLYHEAQMDQLTGLKNRRGFYEYYSDVMESLVKQKDASVIMCDIDFFKKVNDVYGHNAGDAVLVKVSDVLVDSLKGRGEAIRWGGEEFVLLLPEFTELEAAELAERIRSRIEAEVCQYEGIEIRITMSFGVGALNPELTADANIEAVDERLYRAKTTGRNRVVTTL